MTTYTLNLPYITVADYATIQAALDTIAAVGGTVYVPRGIYTEQLVLPSRTRLIGEGQATVIQAPANATRPIIQTAPHAVLCAVHDVMLDGNKANQSGKVDGIVMGNTAPYDKALDAFFDPRHDVRGVFVYQCSGTGVRFLGQTGGHVVQTKVYQCDEYSFVTSWDNTLVGCDSGESGLSGFLINGSSTRLTGCKSWWSGQKEVGVDAFGFYFLNCRSAAVSSCEAQDNERAGFLIESSQRIALSACIADSNGRGGGDADVGFDFWQTNACTLSACVAWNREERADTPQRYALRFRNGCRGNSVQLISDHPGILSPLAANSEDTSGNRVEIVHNGGVWLP